VIPTSSGLQNAGFEQQPVLILNAFILKKLWGRASHFDLCDVFVPSGSLTAISESLLKLECQLPKLDVAGSNPASRSIFSITYSLIADRNLQENGVTSFFDRLELIALVALVPM
jgi:hypothetical protein